MRSFGPGYNQSGKCCYIVPCFSDGKESVCNVGDQDLIPGSERPLETGMATHSSILAWRIPMQRSLVGYCPWGCKQPDMTKQLTQHHYITWENTPSFLIGPGCNQSGICWDGHLLCIGCNQSGSGRGDKNVYKGMPIRLRALQDQPVLVSWGSAACFTLQL